MASKEELADALDHPIVFTFLMALAVAAWLAILTWAFKAANWSGPAGLFQHP